MTLKDLSQLDHAERCGKTKMPSAYVPINKYTDKTAAGLEKSICRFLALKGHQAERIKNMGVAVDNTKTFTDALGFTRKIGSVDYRKGTGTKGSADVHSTIKLLFHGQTIGLKVTWEVKIGKDKISNDQLDYAESVRASGGRAYFVRTWDEFYKYYCQLLAEFGNV